MWCVWRKIGWMGLFLICGLALSTQGCNCGGDPGQSNDKARISFLSPAGALITDGLIRVRVQDNDGTESVVFYIDDQKIDAKEGGGQRDGTFEVRFDLDSINKQEFEIKAESIDKAQDKQSEKMRVRKDASAPFMRFTSPSKLKNEHKAIFVGKQTKVISEGQDKDGVAEITMEYGTQRDEYLPLKVCAGTSTPNKADTCEHDADLSDDAKFPDGATLVFYAFGKDAKGNITAPKARLEVLVDKKGPQIQILKPNAGDSLRGQQEFRALVLDQAGVKQVDFFINNIKAGQIQADANAPGQYFSTADVGQGFGSGEVEFKVIARDELDNISEMAIKIRLGCSSDKDCTATERCCTAASPNNKDGKFTGQCFPIQAQEGALCDPCTTPCGKGGDGRLMGCLPEPCTDQAPFRCRSACNLGNPNLRPDACQPKQGNRPAEYCVRSDITRINPELGACALGHNCDPLNQQTCPAGAQPPYNNCCPAGSACFPADDDANFCVPEGNKKLGETGCNNDICTGNNTCERGALCVVTVDQQGRPVGSPNCRKMCQCDQFCQQGFPLNSGGCSAREVCTPLRLTNGNVPLPVGACASTGGP